jgi:hypothetical protein
MNSATTVAASTFDYLDDIALAVQQGNARQFGPLSSGEKCYVALAASRMDLVPDFNIAQAIERLGPSWTDELVARWRHRSVVSASLKLPEGETPEYAALLSSVLADADMSYQLRARIRDDRERDPMAALRDAHVLYQLAERRAIKSTVVKH